MLPAFYYFHVTVLYVLAGLNMAGNQCQGCSTEIQGYRPNICRVHTKVGDIRMYVHTVKCVGPNILCV